MPLNVSQGLASLLYKNAMLKSHIPNAQLPDSLVIDLERFTTQIILGIVFEHPMIDISGMHTYEIELKRGIARIVGLPHVHQIGNIDMTAVPLNEILDAIIHAGQATDCP